MILGILASAGGAAASASYESIATATGTGSSGTITFSSIASTYTHLQLRINAIATAYSGTGGYVRFNGDTGSNYVFHYLTGTGSAISAGNATAQNSIFVLVNNAVGLHNTSPNAGVLDILDYASTTKNKTLRGLTGVDINSAGDLSIVSGLWLSTSAINSVTVYLGSGSYATTTTVALYGIKAA
jgi:hypothetical protein